MVLVFDKLPKSQIRNTLRGTIYSSLKTNGKNSLYRGVATMLPSKTKGTNNCQKFSFTLDTDKLFEKLKGQEGKYYSLIQNIRYLMDEQKRIENDTKLQQKGSFS